MKPAERIAQLETELAEAKALLSDREEWLQRQDTIIGTMLHKERAKDPDELRTLTFRDRMGKDMMLPTTGVGATVHLKQTQPGQRGGLEGFGAIIERRKREADALAQAQKTDAEQKAA